jgi:hypothetical protein
MSTNLLTGKGLQVPQEGSGEITTDQVPLPWEEKYRHLKEVPIKDIDNGTIASFIMGNSQMEFDLFVIRHSRKITCFAIPKDTMFQIQWETAPRVA